MSEAPDWAIEGADWPNRPASRFVRAAGFGWHVQVLGQGPVVLLLHGTGAATHSWRDLAPLLAESFTVVAPDLPGHGFTEMPPGAALSLPGMARAVSALMDTLEKSPALIVGHSAGAAIALEMVRARLARPQAVVSLNGALRPMSGSAGCLFTPVAKLLAVSGIMPRWFARNARDRQAVARLLAGTGSTLDDRGIDLYARLLRCPRHDAAALGMMARWNLKPLQAVLPGLSRRAALTLVVGSRDRTVPPADSVAVSAHCPRSRLVSLPGLGHLAHEEAPDAVAGLIRQAAYEAAPDFAA